MATVVVDPVALLPFNLDHDVVYCRTPESAVDELVSRQASGRRIDTLWLRWDLETGRLEHEMDAELVIAALADGGEGDHRCPIGKIVVMTYSRERSSQAFERLRSSYEVDSMRPDDTALIFPQAQRSDPRPDLPPMERLRRAGVRIKPGLSDTEIMSVQSRYGFTFSPAHREFLRAGLAVDTVPTRDGWPDWRDGESDELASRILHPDLRLLNAHPAAARDDVPLLIPLGGISYLPSGPLYGQSPVFSAHERDIIYCGASISGWIGITFEGVPWPLVRLPREHRVPLWSDMAEPQ